MARLAIRVDDEVKERWTAHADEHDYKNTSQLVRKAVETQIARDESDDEGEDISMLRNSIERELLHIQSAIRETRQQVASVEDLQATAEQVEELLAEVQQHRVNTEDGAEGIYD